MVSELSVSRLLLASFCAAVYRCSSACCLSVRVIAALDSVAELQYQYLRAIMAGARESLEDMQHQKATGMVKSSSSLSASASVPASPTASASIFLSGGFGSALAETSQSSMSDLLQRAGMTFSPRMHEQYVRLLCQFDPQAVLPHLILHTDYHIEAVLRLCQDKGIDDASAYLLGHTTTTHACTRTCSLQASCTVRRPTISRTSRCLPH